MQPIFTYNQDLGVKAGQAGVQTGAHVFNIEEAEYRNHNGYKSINLTLATDSGKCFIDLTYEDANGKAWNGNINHINAILGICGVNQITSQQVGDKWIAPELTGKSIGAVVRKRLYTKGDGSDGSNTDLVMAFNPTTYQTLKEQVGSEQAVTVNKICETLQDKDDRKSNSQQQNNNHQQSSHNGITGGF